MGIIDDLTARGLVHDTTDRDDLVAALDAGPVTLYHGIDPTADSMHVGNLVGVLALRRFQDFGHRPIALVGGATGMIGDPSGRSDERNLLDDETLAANISGLRAQLERIIDFEGSAGALLVDNRDWTQPVSMLEFLRDVGKHVTVNQMMAKESVRSRLEGEAGISYTEFSYMLLQAFDYWWLHENMSCGLQIGGSDQWGNITAGIDLIRRRSGGAAHGLTWPLITKADGSKFGKSAEGNIWLDAERTSPYRFHQHWIRTDDADVERYLLQLTLLPVEEIVATVAAHAEAPEKRLAQRRLADEMTTLIHGPEACTAAQQAGSILFGSPLDQVGADALEAIVGEVPTTELPRPALGEGVDLLDLLVRTGLASSNGDARRGLAEGSIYVANEREPENRLVTADDLLLDRYLLLRRGRRNYHLLVAVDASGS